MKQILLINDIAGYGKVGMAAMLPILSYMGLPAFNLPTMLVSNTLNYGDYARLDTTEYMRQTLPVWQRLGFHFDAICTGLMFNPLQAQLVSDFCREQASKGCTVYVDPVMGDGGSLYHGMTQEQVQLMRRMVGVAHVAKPNYTEACLLCGVPYREEGISADEARSLLDAIIALGAHSAIITSCVVDGEPQVCGYDGDSREYFFHPYDVIPGLFHGTGDIFSAVLIGSMEGGQRLADATRRAMDVVSRMIDRNRDVEDHLCGIFIERCLDLL